VVVVAVPGLGDDVQAIKAGVLEIADVFAVNKADREGADRTVRELEGMLELRRAVRPLEHDRAHRPTGPHQAGEAGASATGPEWEPPIVRTVAVQGQGTAELAGAIDRHRSHLATTDAGRARGAERARAALMGRLRERLLERALARLEEEDGRLDEVLARIAARQADPYQLADELADRLRSATGEER
jgi:LAO/AO transport system kinase